MILTWYQHAWTNEHCCRVAPSSLMYIYEHEMLMSPPRSWLWGQMSERPCLLASVGTAEAVSAPPAPLQPGTGQPQPLTVYSQPLCACATDFHLVRTQGTEHRAEQDNIDFQSHISGRVVWLLSQDNHVQWGFLGVVQHVGQRHSEGPIIRREGPSILYTHITLGVHTQPQTSESQPKIFVVW